MLRARGKRSALERNPCVCFVPPAPTRPQSGAIHLIEMDGAFTPFRTLSLPVLAAERRAFVDQTLGEHWLRSGLPPSLRGGVTDGPAQLGAAALAAVVTPVSSAVASSGSRGGGAAGSADDTSADAAAAGMLARLERLLARWVSLGPPRGRRVGARLSPVAPGRSLGCTSPTAHRPPASRSRGRD